MVNGIGGVLVDGIDFLSYFAWGFFIWSMISGLVGLIAEPKENRTLTGWLWMSLYSLGFALMFELWVLEEMIRTGL